MKQISMQEAQAMGIQSVHHVMDNGEKRFRLTSASGSSYIMTINSGKAAWQNSHVHNQKKEFYVVEKGWAIVVMWPDREKLEILRLNEDDCCFVPVHVLHNLYVSENTVLHTVKYGTAETDWNACPELDELIQKTDFSSWY